MTQTDWYSGRTAVKAAGGIADLEQALALVAAGASIVSEPGPDVEWWVLADPEGNEFCAFPPSV